jgi:hypothetical protein
MLSFFLYQQNDFVDSKGLKALSVPLTSRKIPIPAEIKNRISTSQGTEKQKNIRYVDFLLVRE